jgi:hypothetical protein
MEGSAAGVDVAAVGRDAHRDDVRAERIKEFGAEFVGSAVGAIEKDAEAGELGAVNDAAAEKIEIFGVERSIGNEERRIFRRRIAAMFENVGFESLFDGVRELHACMREKFYTVVVVRIVGGGNDHASLKIILANEAGDAGRSDDASKSDGTTGLRESGGEESGNMRAGFAGVHADEDVGGRVFAKQISGERASGGKKSGVVKRRSAWNAANTIGSEKFFGHERLAAKT